MSARNLAARALAFTGGAVAAVVASGLFSACGCFDTGELIPVPDGSWELAEADVRVPDFRVTYDSAVKEVRVTFTRDGVAHEYVYSVVSTHRW